MHQCTQNNLTEQRHPGGAMDSSSWFAELPDEALLPVADISVLSRRSRSSIWRDVKEGRLPEGIRIGKSSVRWKVADVRRYLSGEART